MLFWVFEFQAYSTFSSPCKTNTAELPYSTYSDTQNKYSTVSRSNRSSRPGPAVPVRTSSLDRYYNNSQTIQNSDDHNNDDHRWDCYDDIKTPTNENINILDKIGVEYDSGGGVSNIVSGNNDVKRVFMFLVYISDYLTNQGMKVMIQQPTKDESPDLPLPPPPRPW